MRWIGPQLPRIGGGIGQPAPSLFPLSVAANGRYLVDALGRPFPIIGDSAWTAGTNLTVAEQVRFLKNRQAKGFNFLLLQFIDKVTTISKPPKNLDGSVPFSKRLDGNDYTGSPNGCNGQNGSGVSTFSPDPTCLYAADPYSNINNEAPDFTFPNETYWAAIDRYLSLCAGYGFGVLAFPAYVGFGGNTDQWMVEQVANDAVTGAGGFAGQPFADGAKSKLWNYGAWLADRYKARKNIVWVHGGDYGSGSSSGTFSTPEKNAVTNLAAGIRSVSGQVSTFHTGHWSRPSLATDVTLTGITLDLESTYVGLTPAVEQRSAYSHSPTAPNFVIEAYYANRANAGSDPRRKYLWWALTSGGAGVFFGDEWIWTFNAANSGWESHLNDVGSDNVKHIASFLRLVAWHKLVPSGLNGMATIVTANGHTTADQTYVSAAASAGGEVCVSYVPPEWASGTFTIDVSIMRGTSTVRWYDPTNGAYSSDGTVSNSGTHAFTPPGTNAAGDTDWILLLEA